jgi:hypothetical protein
MAVAGEGLVCKKLQKSVLFFHFSFENASSRRCVLRFCFAIFGTSPECWWPCGSVLVIFG